MNQNEQAWEPPAGVNICEVGPRDGLQNEKIMLSVEQKIKLIEMTAEAGVRTIEIGSFVHPQAVPPMADTDKVAAEMKRFDGVEYRALVMNVRGMERAKAVGINKVKLTVSASRTHSLTNMKRTPEQVFETFAECAEYAAKQGMTLAGAIATAFGCPFEGKVPVEKVLNAIESFIAIGVKELSLSDTTGMANPRQVFEYGRTVMKKYPRMVWNLHFHNTRGMGLSNVLAGMMAGIVRYDASFAGIGGCPFAPGATGNIATEDLVHMLHEMDVHTRCNLDAITATAKTVRDMVGHETGSFVLRAGKCSDLHATR